MSKIILNISNLPFLAGHEALLKQEEKAMAEFYSAHKIEGEIPYKQRSPWQSMGDILLQELQGNL